jgi:CRP-like cAMP-binding protein
MSSQPTSLFLSGLSSASRSTLVSESIAVEIPLHAVLLEAGHLPHHAYFLTSGLASIVTSMRNGETAEVGFIGHEGIVGGLQLLGPTAPPTRCMMQLAGTGLKLSFAVLQRMFHGSEEIRTRVLELVQEQTSVLSQIAGCNRLHSAEQRLTRWLLMARDQTQSEVLKFTQEYLSEMIGTQRTTVTVLAGALQERHLIRYTRGTIRILDGPGLEAITCDCYAIIKRLYDNLYRRDPGWVAPTTIYSSSSADGSIGTAFGSSLHKRSAG